MNPSVASDLRPSDDRRWTWWYALPVALVAMPAVIYALSPSFYRSYVLDHQLRESQAVEMVTFVCGVVGGALLLSAAWRLWKRRPGVDFGPRGVRGLPDRHLAWALPATVGAAAWFFAGEVVNWGQTFLHWRVPEREQLRGMSVNLHNNSKVISLMSLGSGFLLGVFLVWPVVWRFRERLNLPGLWHVAVPWGPAILAVVMGFSLTRLKDLYAATLRDPKSDLLYVGYFEQLNEQKEMLFAVAMLLMGVGVWQRLSAASA